MEYEHYPLPQSVVAAFVELTRYLLDRARLQARDIQRDIQQDAAVPLDAPAGSG
jgi:hypothetical protein